MISRRSILKGTAAFAGGNVLLGGYALGIEPMRTTVTRYRVSPAAWPKQLKLSIAVLADIHACEPWMSVSRIEGIVSETNALGADLVVLLGDYVVAQRWYKSRVPERDWATALGRLKAPLGVHAILGNHDWWDDPEAQERGRWPVASQVALERAGVAVYENSVQRLAKDGQSFWLAGLGDQLALLARATLGRGRWRGVDDLVGTLAKAGGAEPVILMAHEPDIFASVPARVALTLSGHTHGGQVRLAGYSPVVPSRYGNRYAYGHIVEDNRHLVVSGGLGLSIAPVRFGVPPEIVLIEVGAKGPAAV